MPVLTLNDSNYDLEVTQAPSNTSVLIDFYADWCGPCKMLSPIINEIADEPHNNLKVCKLNVDTSPDIASKFEVMSIPTIVVIKNGEPIQRSVGLKNKQAILDMLN